jgi:hypothetical protein
VEAGRFGRFEVKIASETLPDGVPLLYHLTGKLSIQNYLRMYDLIRSLESFEPIRIAKCAGPARFTIPVQKRLSNPGSSNHRLFCNDMNY